MRHFCWKTIRALFLNQQIAFLAVAQVLKVLLKRSEMLRNISGKVEIILKCAKMWKYVFSE